MLTQQYLFTHEVSGELSFLLDTSEHIYSSSVQISQDQQLENILPATGVIKTQLTKQK